jgi:hypothetical protein
VKPGNVLVGTNGTVKIADFGIAWSASSVPLTGTGQVVGTAHYLSPEQAEGGKATPASDVYALGTVAYECLAGRRAFDGENSVQIALKQIREEPLPLPADVPAPIRAVVERAMAKDPAARHPDGAALRDAVEAAAASSPTVPVADPVAVATAVFPAPHSSSGRSVAQSRPAGRRAAVRVGAGLAAAVVAVVALVGALAGGGGADPASGGEPTSSSTASSAPATPTTVAVVAAGLVGRPVADVQADLVSRGVQVQLVPTETSDVAAGVVTAVSPEGELAPATVVTVTYAVAPVASPAPAPAPVNTDGGNGNGHGKGHGKKD